MPRPPRQRKARPEFERAGGAWILGSKSFRSVALHRVVPAKRVARMMQAARHPAARHPLQARRRNSLERWHLDFFGRTTGGRRRLGTAPLDRIAPAHVRNGMG